MTVTRGFCLAAVNSSCICSLNNRTGRLSGQAIGGVTAACSTGDVRRTVGVDTFFEWLIETGYSLIKQDFFIFRAIHVESPSVIRYLPEFKVVSGDSVRGAAA